jgi:hypothetical protein
LKGLSSSIGGDNEMDTGSGPIAERARSTAANRAIPGSLKVSIAWPVGMKRR